MSEVEQDAESGYTRSRRELMVLRKKWRSSNEETRASMLDAVEQAEEEYAKEKRRQQEAVRQQVREMVLTLLAGPPPLTPQELADAIGNRVSGRTIYRWTRGDSVPHQQAHVAVLQRLLRERTQEK